MALAAARQLLHSSRQASLLNLNVLKTVNLPRSLFYSTFPALINKTTSSDNKNDTPESRWSTASFVFHSRRKTPPANAYSGRSIRVDGGDVASASRKLEHILMQNSIPREWRRSFRHRQKGEERRKLESTRWRKRFKFEVSKKVKLVQQIRRRGS